MRKAHLVSVLVGLAAVVMLTADAAAMYSPTTGRFLQRDPAGFADGMNAYSYVQDAPHNGRDPTGLWKRSADNRDHWCADSPKDTLQSLARDHYGAEDSWMCIWPIGSTQDHGYAQGTVQVGDRYDASNLALTSGPSVYITMDASLSAYMQDRSQAVVAPSDASMRSELARASGEGATPIHYFELVGHSWGWAGISPGSGGRRKARKKGQEPGAFFPRARSDLPQITFERAKARKGPTSCWFTRSAKGYVFACGGRTCGVAFADEVLRRGAVVYTTFDNTMTVMHDTWFSRNDYGFRFGVDVFDSKGEPIGVKALGDVDWYSNIDDFLNSSRWARVEGGN